jgi:hypothetical protein
VNDLATMEGIGVTDENLWASPDGSKPATPPQPGAPQPGAPQFGAPLPQPAGAWAPPPKPGLIPLAPMTLGTILGASFRVLRRNPRPVVGVSLIVQGIIAIVTIVVTSYALTSLGGILTRELAGALPSSSEIGTVFLAYLNDFGTAALGLIGTNILLGIVSLEVARATLGERLPLAALWRRARGRLLVLVGWALAMVAAIVLLFGILIGLVVLAVAGAAGSSGNNVGGALVAIVLGLLLLFGGVIVLFWLGVKLSLVPTVLVIERLPLGRAMRRSWALTRGYFWRTLGIELLVWLILSVASGVIETPVAGILLVVNGLTHPTGSGLDALAATDTLSVVITTVLKAIVATMTAIVSTASTALIYLDLRIRKEGLDLQLMRFVDARQAGRTDVADPYVVAPPLPDATNT